MNIENLNNAKEILLREISVKATGLKEQSELITIIADLELLINHLTNPEKADKIKRLCIG